MLSVFLNFSLLVDVILGYLICIEKKALAYPVGLITADEIVAAGSAMGGTLNKSYYLYYPNMESFSFSSYGFVDGGWTHTNEIFIINTNGELSHYYGFSVEVVSPVINLKVDYFQTLIGTGEVNNRYRKE